MNLFHELLLVCAAQGLLLCTVILSLRTTHPLANRLLALYVGLESLHLFLLYAAYSFYDQLPSLQLCILFGMRVLNAPALYLYARALTDERFRFDASLARHLLVLVPTAVFSIWLASSTDWDSTSALSLQRNNIVITWSLYHSLISVGYAVFALRRVNAHLRRLQQALSSLDSVDLGWLQRLLCVVLAVDFVNVGYDVLRSWHVLGAQPKVAFNLFTTLSIVYWLSIGGLRQQAIFTEAVRKALAAFDRDAPPEEIGGTNETASCAEARPDRLAKTGLDAVSIERIWRQLQELLEREKPYLDPLLDLPGLARQLNRRPQELSLVINSRSGGSFYDLINGYRVEAAQRLLTDPSAPRRKMLDIALSVGFSSQSTFYNQFRKATGTTPTAFRDSGGRVLAEVVPQRAIV